MYLSLNKFGHIQQRELFKLSYRTKQKGPKSHKLKHYKLTLGLFFRSLCLIWFCIFRELRYLEFLFLHIWWSLRLSHM